MPRKLQPADKAQIIDLWNQAYTSAEIISMLNLDVGRRTIERVGKAGGDWKQRWLRRMERLEHNPASK
jgi:hypothetical protein